GASPVLESEKPQVGRPRDQGRPVYAVPRGDVEVHAVVVEAEPRDRSGVPPIQVPGVPAGMDQHRLEVGPVAYEPSGDAFEPARADRIRDGVDRGERRVARARGEA